MNEKTPDRGSSPSPARKCPICKKPVGETAKTFPFCSSRCKTIDLARWATGEYVITRPVEESDLEEED